MKLKGSLSVIFPGVALLALAAGCATEVVKIPVQPTVLPAGNKSPFHVALLLNADLAKYQYEFHVGGNSMVFPLGPALENYARHVAANSFKQVDEASDSATAFANPSTDLVLIPRAVKAEQTMGTRVQNPYSFILVVEWQAKDRASQNTVWLKTITAEATVPAANPMTAGFHVEDRRNNLMQMLFDNLNVQTFETMQRATELGFSRPAVGPGQNPPGDPKVFVVMLGLKSSDPGEIVQTLKLLRTPESAAAAPAILPLLTHPNANVVRDACRTLALIANKDVIPSIEPLLKDKRPAVRKDAQDAIDKLRQKP